MLCLKRGVNETIHINNDIVLTVLEVRRGSVRLGVEAPQGTPVYRGEVWQDIQSGKPPPWLNETAEPDGAGSA